MTTSPVQSSSEGLAAFGDELLCGVLVGKGVRWHTLVIALQRVSTDCTPSRSVSMGPPACLPGGPNQGEWNG